MKEDIDFLTRLMNLKDEKRAWVDLYGIEEGETVADHSWGVSLLVLYFSGEVDVNTEKCLKMAALHDLAEAETGDIANRLDDDDRKVSEKEKERMERKVWEEFEKKKGDFVDYWEEYSEKRTKEAKFVKDMDLIDLCLQALKYEKEERYDEKRTKKKGLKGLDEVFQNSRRRIQTETGRKIFNNISEIYRKEKS